MTVKPIPEGYHSVTPYLIVDGAAGLLEFIAKVFDAKERGDRMQGPDGTIGHAEILIGDSLVMVSDASEQFPAANATLNVYVEDSDAVFARAVEAGAETLRPMETQFYGDRSGGVRDQWGNAWWISTHVEDVAPDEMERRAKEYMEAQQQQT